MLQDWKNCKMDRMYKDENGKWRFRFGISSYKEKEIAFKRKILDFVKELSIDNIQDAAYWINEQGDICITLQTDKKAIGYEIK